MSKAADAFRTISEVADELDVPKHVLRFWEVKFPQIKPMKRGGGRRYYRPEDVQLLRAIHRLLHGDGYTIRGVQKKLRAEGVEKVKAEAAGAPSAAITGKRTGRTASKPAASAGPRVAAGVDPRLELLRSLLSTLADLRADLKASAAPKPSAP
jgi:DNA-binding transcriptional MerR regulator